MNMASSRSHCVYIFTVKQEVTMDKRYVSSISLKNDWISKSLSIMDMWAG